MTRLLHNLVLSAFVLYSCISVSVIAWDMLHMTEAHASVVQDPPPCACNERPQIICVNDPVYMSFFKIKLLRPDLPNHIAKNYAELIHKYARAYSVDPDLVTAVIRVESYWNPNAVSPVGALGLMQVMPFWIEALSYGNNLRDPETSIKYGTRILRVYQDAYPDNLFAAIASYNQGPAMVDRDLKQGISTWGFSTRVMTVYKMLKELQDMELHDPATSTCTQVSAIAWR